jgi:hypothetical protein
MKSGAKTTWAARSRFSPKLCRVTTACESAPSAVNFLKLDTKAADFDMPVSQYAAVGVQSSILAKMALVSCSVQC